MVVLGPQPLLKPRPLVVLYIAIQTIESYLLTPLLQQQAVSLPPA